MESIHGHEVMHLIAGSSESRSRQDWVSVIEEKFGASARFHTCSAENLSVGQLLDFLEERGKFASRDGGVRIDRGDICDH
ncbi:MAG: YecH family metal-binding protein [Verrucomicrobiales bacterium]|nr:YecH family protein [Verrucomicrobiota bacterium JB025]